MSPLPLQFLVLMVSSWLNRRQHAAIESICAPREPRLARSSRSPNACGSPMPNGAPSPRRARRSDAKPSMRSPRWPLRRPSFGGIANRWRPSTTALPSAVDLDDPRARGTEVEQLLRAHGARQSLLGLHPVARRAAEPGFAPRAVDDSADSQGPWHRAGSRSRKDADALEDLPRGPLGRHRSGRFLQRRGAPPPAAASYAIWCCSSSSLRCVAFTSSGSAANRTERGWRRSLAISSMRWTVR